MSIWASLRDLIHAHGFRHSPGAADEIPGVIVLVPSEDNPTQDPYTPEEGDLLVGQTAPLGFARYPFDPADSASTRNVLAGDQGDTKPTWKALLDGTDPAAVAEDASPGTSLIAAHRDHVHHSNKVLKDYEGLERLIITAHHGDINTTDGYPQDTMEAFRLAAIRGVNRVDLDPRLSSDGTWHVLHDSTVDRTTDGTGTIASKTDAQIAALTIDGGYGYDAGRHAALALKIPTLEAVITALLPYDITFQLDNKVQASAASLAQFCVDNEIVHRVLITATSQAVVDAIHAVDSRIATIGGPEQFDSYYDWHQATYTAVLEDDVLDAAPRPFSTYIAIEDWGTVDEGQIVEDMFALGVRAVTVNDIAAALAAKAGLFGGGGSSSGGGPSEVSFGSEAADGEGFVNDSGAEAFTQFGNITRLFGLNNFAFDTPKVVFEANLKTNDSGLTAKARLYDITDGAVVSGSTVQTTSETPDRIRSGYLTIDDAEHEYRAEFGGDDTIEATIYAARVLAGTSTMVSEGADGETSPPVAATVGDDVANEIRNFPAQFPFPADDIQPGWWGEEDGDQVLTEVDVAGEGITEKYERAHKLVSASAGYAYQEYTLADEPRMKAGKTYSVSVDAWMVSSLTGRIRLQSSVGSLGASLDTTAAAWTRLEVEGVALNGTTLQLRYEVDAAGTSYWHPLGLVEGTEAPTTELRARNTIYQLNPNAATEVEDLSGQTSKAVADLDLTSASHPLAVMGNFTLSMFEGGASTSAYQYFVRPNGTSWAVNTNQSPAIRGIVRGDDVEGAINNFVCPFDESQIVETAINALGTTTAIDLLKLYLNGWWQWE